MSDSVSVSRSTRSSQIGIELPSLTSGSASDSRSDSRSAFRKTLLFHEQRIKQAREAGTGSSTRSSGTPQPPQQQQPVEEREQRISRLGGGASRVSLATMRSRRRKASSIAASQAHQQALPSPITTLPFKHDVLADEPEVDRLESAARGVGALQNAKTIMQTKRNSFNESSSRSSPTPPSPTEERDAVSSSPPTPWTIIPASISSTSAAAGGDIPPGHVKTISELFGSLVDGRIKVDLYRDVLMVSPDASDREIRIAYFRRGREVLCEGGCQESVPAGGTLDAATRMKFEAISMAYEILTTPAWKETYLKHGLLVVLPTTEQQQPQQPPLKDPPRVEEAASSEENDNVGNGTPAGPNVASSDSAVSSTINQNNTDIQEEMSTASLPNSSIRLAPSLRSGRRSITSSTSFDREGSAGELPQLKLGVRWKEHVEEMVFENHPNEHAPSFDVEEEDDDIYDDDDFYNDRRGRSRKSSGSSSTIDSLGRDTKESHKSPSIGSASTKKRKKSKPKVVIESDELESHLLRMDEEAQKHFVVDFFDNFEESLDGILSLVDSIGDSFSSPRRSSRSLSSKNRHVRSSKSDSAPEKVQSTYRIGKSRSHDSGDTDKKKGRSNDDSSEIKRSSSFPSPAKEPMTAHGAANNVRTSFSSQGSDETAKMKTVASSRSVMSSSALSSTNTDVAPPSLTSSVASTPNGSGSGLTSPIGGVSREGPMNGTSQVEQSIEPEPEHNQRKHDSSSSPPDEEQSSALERPLFRPISPSNSQGADQFDSESLNQSDIEVHFQEERESLITTQESSQDHVAVSPDPVTGASIATRSSKRVSVSMVKSTRKGVPESSSLASSVGNRHVSPSPRSKGKASKSEESEDIFDGLDDTLKYLMEADAPVTGRDISLERSNSTCNSSSFDCYSDLSESIFMSGRSVTRDTDTANERETFPSAVNKFRSRAETNWKSILPMGQLSTASGDISVHSLESPVEDASGFYNYFIAYVKAIMTECIVAGNQTQNVYGDFISFCHVDNPDPVDTREPAASVSAGSYNSWA